MWTKQKHGCSAKSSSVSSVTRDSPGSAAARARCSPSTGVRSARTATDRSSGAKPVSDADAQSLAAQFPELTLRVEPAHREAYVAVGTGPVNPAQWQLADQALRRWAEDQGIDPDQLALKPEDLGVRITYLATEAPAESSGPDCDFAVPFG